MPVVRKIGVVPPFRGGARSGHYVSGDTEEKSMTHVAKCHCGGVEIICAGDPDPVIVCHCLLCQRRTGSLFQVAAWFKQDLVKIHGTTKKYTRTTDDSGLPFTFNFCDICGTTIWWAPARLDGPLKNKLAIAGGCFLEEGFPKPTISIYEKHRHSWVSLPPDIRRYNEGLNR